MHYIFYVCIPGLHYYPTLFACPTCTLYNQYHVLKDGPVQYTTSIKQFTVLTPYLLILYCAFNLQLDGLLMKLF